MGDQHRISERLFLTRMDGGVGMRGPVVTSEQVMTVLCHKEGIVV